MQVAAEKKRVHTHHISTDEQEVEVMPTPKLGPDDPNDANAMF